jgi:hypothetical protein
MNTETDCIKFQRLELYTKSIVKLTAVRRDRMDELSLVTPPHQPPLESVYERQIRV